MLGIVTISLEQLKISTILISRDRFAVISLWRSGGRGGAKTASARRRGPLRRRRQWPATGPADDVAVHRCGRPRRRRLHRPRRRRPTHVT